AGRGHRGAARAPRRGAGGAGVHASLLGGAGGRPPGGRGRGTRGGDRGHGPRARSRRARPGGSGPLPGGRAGLHAGGRLRRAARAAPGGARARGGEEPARGAPPARRRAARRLARLGPRARARRPPPRSPARGGGRAYDERELLEQLEEVPRDSLYFHTHSCFLHEPSFPGGYPNDFATWAAIQVRDRVLGEKLGIVDPQDFSDLESLRAEVVSLIDDHLAETRSVPRVMFGQPFYFMQSRVLEIPTGVKVRTLAEFRDALARVDTAVVYLHVVEARGRKGRRRN